MADAAPAQPAGKDLSELKKYFDDSRSQNQEGRLQGLLARDAYDGEQLSDTTIKALKDRKQPQIVRNRIRGGVNGILGVVEQGRTDPRALMRNPPDDMAPPQQPQQTQGRPGAPQKKPKPPLDAGDVASMALRYISDTSHFQPLKMDVLENGLIEGYGAAIVEGTTEGAKEVTITQIRWEDYFYDPRSRRPDFQDKRYDGIAKWMYADMVVAIYPEAKDKLGDFVASGNVSIFGGFDATWEDRPDNLQPWIDSKQKRLMVVEMYYLEANTWWRCVFYAGGKLEDAVSPYKDEDGKPVNPIEAWSCYVDRKNRRYGVVRDMSGPQDEINMRAIKAVHEINTRQVQQEDPNAPPVDTDIVRQEAARPDGVIPPGWKIVPRQDVVANNLTMLQEAKGEIERFGPNPAILGRQGADASGRAQQIRQQAGMTELARPLGRFNDWELRIYKQCWARARQFWNDPKWIRVTGDDGAPQYVRINEPQPHPDPMMAAQGMAGPPKNHIAKMDVDIIVDPVPDTATLQQEIFTELTQLAKVYGPQSVPFKILLRMSALPKRRELEQALEEAQAEQAQASQPQAQIEMHKAMTDTEATHATTVLKQAQAGLTEVQTVTAALEGHMKATTAAQLPPGVTLNGSGVPVHMTPMPPPGPSGTGAAGSAQPVI